MGTASDFPATQGQTSPAKEIRFDFAQQHGPCRGRGGGSWGCIQWNCQDRSLPPGPAQLLLVLNVRQLARWKGQGNSQGQGQELCPRPHAESPGGNLLPAAPKSQSPALLSQHQSPSGQQLDLAALGNDHGCCHQQNPDAAAATLAAKRLPPHGAVQRVPLVVEGCVF